MDRTSHFLQFLACRICCRSTFPHWNLWWVSEGNKNIALLVVQKGNSILEPRQRSTFVCAQTWCHHSEWLPIEWSTPVQLIAQLTKKTSYFWYIPSKEIEGTINLLEKPLAHLSIRGKNFKVNTELCRSERIKSVKIR
jgi:hypothetical protein